jgi:predicted GNAT family N-acyltransferase
MGVRVELLPWEEARPIAAPIRFAVFVGEQKVPADIELDDMDGKSLHAIAYDETGKPVGTGRLLPEGHIGRMAVVKEWRRRGVGADLLDALVTEARRRGLREVKLSAQVHASAFYLAHGFVAEGKVYDEVGILH